MKKHRRGRANIKNKKILITCSPAPTIARRLELYSISTMIKAPTATKVIRSYLSNLKSKLNKNSGKFSRNWEPASFITETTRVWIKNFEAITSANCKTTAQKRKLSQNRIAEKSDNRGIERIPVILIERSAEDWRVGGGLGSHCWGRR